MQTTRVPQPLRERLGQDATLGLVDLLEGNRRQWSDDVLSTAAQQITAVGERLEHRISKLEHRMSDLEQRMSEFGQRMSDFGQRMSEFERRLSELQQRISDEVSALRVEMHKELASLRVEWLR